MPRGKPFAKGHKGIGGRKPGVPNRVTREGREVALRLVTDAQYQKALQERLRQGRVPPQVEEMLWARAHGGVPKAVELTGANGGPIQTEDLTKATPEELARLAALHEEIAAR